MEDGKASAFVKAMAERRTGQAWRCSLTWEILVSGSWVSAFAKAMADRVDSGEVGWAGLPSDFELDLIRADPG
jgi:hypothetical protein